MMNTLNYIRGVYIITVALGLLASCNSSTVSKAIQASGRPGEVMLVMEAQYLDKHQTSDLIGALQQEAPALPQEEPMMQVTSRVPRQNFDAMMKRSRNILIVDIDSTRFSKSTLKYSYNEWADGQLVLTLNTPSLDSLSRFSRERGEVLTSLLVRHELYRFGRSLVETCSKRAETMVDSLFGHRVNVPNDIRSHKIGQGFLWMSNAQMGGRRDFMIYTFPFRGGKDLSKERLLEVRDSVLKANIAGEFEGSYPSTVKTGLIYRQVSMPESPERGELRGLWQMEGGAMMGGPFVLQAYHNVADNLVYVIDVFVYKPNENKLNLIRGMEAALYTLRPSGEEEFQPKDILGARYTRATKHE